MSKSNPRNLTYAAVYQVALDMFQYDKDKANSWWMKKDASLKMSPYEMVKNGHGRKLIKLMQRCK